MPPWPPTVKNLAPLLEQTWVRTTFLDANERSFPALHGYLTTHTEITTARALTEAVDTVRAQQASGTDDRDIRCSSRASPAANPKCALFERRRPQLIGGGAVCTSTNPG